MAYRRNPLANHSIELDGSRTTLMSWTRRRSAGVAGIIAAVAILSACASPATVARNVGAAATVCPSQPHAVATNEPGAERQQVPFTPNHALACRYVLKLARSTPSSTTHLRPQRTLAGSAALGAQKARDLSSLINQDSVSLPGGTMNCGPATGTIVNVYFAATGKEWVEVSIAPTGCFEVTNGTLTQWSPSGKMISTVVKLTS
jgi:hypothetical protein